MKQKTIYAITQGSSEGEYTCPFFEIEKDAEEYIAKKKEESKWPLDMWITEADFFPENGK